MNFIRPNKIRPTDGVSKASGMAFRNKCASAAENTVFKLGKLISSTVRVPTNIVSGTLSTFGTMTHSAARLANNTLFGDQSKTADNSTITKHKASKESQLKVESQNLKLALEKQGIIEPKINTIITNFEETANHAIKEKFTIGPMTNKELSSATKNIRENELSPKKFLQKINAQDLGVDATNLQEKQKEIEKSLNSTRSAALDHVGQHIIGKSGLKKEITVDNKTIKTTIKQQSDQFVSSDSNTKDFTHCGNLHKQEVEGGISSFRSAAITVKVKKGDKDLSISGSQDTTVQTLAEKFNTNEKIALCKEWGFEASKIPNQPEKDEKFMTQLTKKVALRNKAIDLISKAAQDAGEGPLNLTSLSLMTPDRPRGMKDFFKGKGFGGEIAKLQNQRNAFELIRNMSDESKKNSGIKDSKGNAMEVNIMDFNFGVNEGESLGRLFQVDKNKASMEKLADTTKKSIEKNQQKLTHLQDPLNGNQNNKKQLEAKIAMQVALLKDIQGKFDEFNDFQSFEGAAKGKGAWKADKAYDLTSKIATLTSLNGDQNHCNCASGKDRTGMHMALAISNDQLIQEQLTLKANNPDHKIDTRTTSEKIDNLNFELMNIGSRRTKGELTADIKTERKRNLAIMLESGQKEVQKANTGSEGYKLMSGNAVNWLTGGGQTEAFFEKLTGLTKEEIANEIVGDAKYNKT